MIAVIADDLTGAAELAGAAADLGLSAEVQTTFRPESRADVIAIDSDTRSLSASDAARAVGEIARDVLRARPDWLYKKTDSVLRGNVRPEITALLAATSLPGAMLVPANPTNDRVIVGGVYYVGGVPLDQTPFARDPEHPRRSSRVAELLGDPDLPPHIDIPDVACAADLVRHARELDAATLPAGGVEFFQAILRTRRVTTERAAPHPEEPRITRPEPGRRWLLVCGSAQAWAQDRRTQCDCRGVPVLAMPDKLFASPDPSSAQEVGPWADAVIAALATNARATIAIGRDVHAAASPRPKALAATLVAAAARVLRHGDVDRVLVEGGATAAALFKTMGWTRLVALPCQAPGVAALQPHGATTPTLLVKPGSYPWPDQVWPDAHAARKE